MNIKNIKLKANELLLTHKLAYTRILFIMLLVGMIPTVLSCMEGTIGSLLYLIATIVMLSFDHGYIVSSLKVVRNNAHALDDQDAFVGIKRFSELFGTYLLVALLQFFVIFVVCIIAMSAMATMAPQLSIIDDPLVILSMLSGPLLLFFLVILVILIIMGIYLFAVPYLLEQYGYKGMDAIKESISFIKGHALDLFKLRLSYFLWVLLVGMASLGVTAMFSVLGVFGSIVAAVITGVLGIISYVPKYYLALAIFFEEIAYIRYRTNTYNQQINKEIDVQGENDVY